MSICQKNYQLIETLETHWLPLVADIKRLIIIASDGRNFEIIRSRTRAKKMAEQQMQCQLCGRRGVRVELFSFPDCKVPKFRNVLAVKSAEGSLMTIDHILPRSKGGETIPSNLQVLCEPCNKAKGASVPQHIADLLPTVAPPIDKAPPVFVPEAKARTTDRIGCFGVIRIIDRTAALYRAGGETTAANFASKLEEPFNQIALLIIHLLNEQQGKTTDDQAHSSNRQLNSSALVSWRRAQHAEPEIHPRFRAREEGRFEPTGSATPQPDLHDSRQPAEIK